MESPEVEVSTTEIELYECCKPLEVMSPAVDLTPGRRNLMNKYLSLKENEPWPLLAEYFGVALAFSALGALIRGLNGSMGTAEVKLSLKLQRIALQAMLKGAMERLQCLAQNAEDLKQRLKESTDARTEDRATWEIEKRNLLQKIADAKIDVAEIKRRREEDAKANEKVVQIYASQEQSWRSERKKLRHEIDLLRKDLIRKEVSGLFNPRSTPVRSRCCEECKAKAKHLKELEETLSEKEFLMMRAMEEAQSEEHERNELAEKLIKAEAIAAELREKIATDDSNKRQQQAFMAEMAAKQQETECKLETVLEHLEKAKADIVAVTENRDATIEKLFLDLATLQKDLDDKEEVIRVMLLRASIEREEKEELAREVSQSKALRKQAEGEKDRWKRLAEEKSRTSSSGKDVRPSRRSLGSRTDLEKLVDLRRAHAEELQSMRSLYGTQIEALDSEIEMYKRKILQLEEIVEIQHTDREQEGKRERQSAELAKLPEPAESSTPVRRSWRASNFEEPMKDPAFKEWLEVVKGRHAAHLEDRHWHEVEAFERQMRVKDEKIGAFRSQLLAMEAETTKLKSELKTLRSQSSKMDKCSSEATDGKNQKTLSTKKCMRSLEGEYVQNVVVNKDVSPDVNLEQDMVELLHFEIAGAMKKLEEKDLEHQTNLLKMAENAEAELWQKDIQLAVVEAELCQMQKRSEERNPGLKASTDICQEKLIMMKNNNGQDDQEPLVEKMQYSSTGGENQTQQDDDSENKAEGLVHPAAVAFNSHRLPSADSLSEEGKAMILSHPDVATKGFLHLQDHNVLLDDQETTGKPLQVDGLEKVGKTNVVPAELSQSVPIEKHPKSLSRLDKKTIIMGDLHSRERKGLTKQPSFRAADHFPTSRKKMYSSSLVQAPHVQSFKPIRKDLFQSLEGKKLPDKHQPQPNLSKDQQTRLSPRTKGAIIKRRDSQTREEIQLLGLALEVRKIEQQLAMMNKAPATCKTEVHHKPLKAQGRLQTKAVTPQKKTRQYAALAGKVNELAKQIGLASGDENLEATINSPEEQDPLTTVLCLPKNRLFTQEPSSSELILLQQRAEAVSENLAAIQAKFSNESYTNILAKDTVSLICKGPLVDTVRAHLSQVQLALSLKLACTVPAPEENTYLNASHQVHAGCFQEDLKGVARFDRRDSKPSKQETHSQSVIGKQAQAILCQQEPTVELQR